MEASRRYDFFWHIQLVRKVKLRRNGAGNI